MTLKEWFKDPVMQEEWRKTWSLPHMRTALELLNYMSLPRPEAVPAGVDLIQWAALTGERRVGFALAVRTLHHLGEPRPDIPEPKEGWGAVELDRPPKTNFPENKT